MKKTIEVVGQIYDTKDYDSFSFLDTNRIPNQTNLKKIVESMKKEHLRIPIIVNEKMQIIDGQHRFLAEKQLGLPVYYIINAGYGLEQVKRANTTGSNWTLEDFLHSHAHDLNYNMVAKIKKTYGLHLNTLLRVISSITANSFDMLKDEFKTGSFAFTEEQKAKVIDFCEQLKFFKDFKGAKANAFVLAFLKLYIYEDYNAEQMKKQAERYMKVFNPPNRNQETLLEELCEKVYSYRISKPEQWIYYKKSNQKFVK
jgi:hypothetical protein